MIYEDDRTEEEKQEYNCLITATDRFMSGWGRAEGGASKCAWAVRPEDCSDMLTWVQDRPDMKYVNVHYRNKWKPRNAAHVHIYIAKRGKHPALPVRGEISAEQLTN